jgi:hypothetical protein
MERTSRYEELDYVDLGFWLALDLPVDLRLVCGYVRGVIDLWVSSGHSLSESVNMIPPFH